MGQGGVGTGAASREPTRAGLDEQFAPAIKRRSLPARRASRERRRHGWGAQEQPADQDKKAGSEASASSAQASSAKDKARKRPGKQPGAQGCWRTQPLVITAPDAEHYPPACDCGAASCVEQKTRQVSAHLVCDLERGDGQLRITVVKHCYFAITWSCGHETIAAMLV